MITHALPRLLAVASVAALAACSPRASDDSAMVRGDRAFAAGDMEEALAEYRLAVRQGGDDDPDVLARVAHTFSRMGRVDEAREFYREAAERDERYRDQAVSDLVHLARDARSRSDRFQMASAVETALEFRPGLSVTDLALPLARHYFQAGEFGRALPFYQKALLAVSDSTPEVVMEIGTAYHELGDCENGLVFFERFRDMVRPWERGEVDWYVGTCALELAQQKRRRAERDTDMEEALRLVERTLEVGEPRNVQGQAWFEKGEILSEMAQCDAALEAFRQVRMAESSGSGALVTRAEERIDEIRFGRGLAGIRGRC
ncbi:MAG: tetratricopeptide repeat protein [Gemmatimonadetes bacterium]|nr:tetratricopeptide repeat protein [Gemmatimonadota bacterium]